MQTKGLTAHLWDPQAAEHTPREWFRTKLAKAGQDQWPSLWGSMAKLLSLPDFLHLPKDVKVQPASQGLASLNKETGLPEIANSSRLACLYSRTKHASSCVGPEQCLCSERSERVERSEHARVCVCVCVCFFLSAA